MQIALEYLSISSTDEEIKMALDDPEETEDNLEPHSEAWSEYTSIGNYLSSRLPGTMSRSLLWRMLNRYESGCWSDRFSHVNYYQNPHRLSKKR